MADYMNQEYQSAKAASAASAINAGLDAYYSALDAYDGAQAWPDGGLDDIQLGMLAMWELIDQLGAS